MNVSLYDWHTPLCHLHDCDNSQLASDQGSMSFPPSKNNCKACALGNLTKFPLSPTILLEAVY